MKYKKLKLVDRCRRADEQEVDKSRLCVIGIDNAHMYIATSVVQRYEALVEETNGELALKAFRLDSGLDWIIVEHEKALYLVPMERD
jgi:hypothetical protein